MQQIGELAGAAHAGAPRPTSVPVPPTLSSTIAPIRVTLSSVTIDGGVAMGLGDVAGIGALKEALTITNRNLELVLAELKETNRLRLESVTAELRQMNSNLKALLEADQAVNSAP